MKFTNKKPREIITLGNVPIGNYFVLANDGREAVYLLPYSFCDFYKDCKETKAVPVISLHTKSITTFPLSYEVIVVKLEEIIYYDL